MAQPTPPSAGKLPGVAFAHLYSHAGRPFLLLQTALCLRVLLPSQSSSLCSVPQSAFHYKTTSAYFCRRSILTPLLERLSLEFRTCILVAALYLPGAKTLQSSLVKRPGGSKLVRLCLSVFSTGFQAKVCTRVSFHHIGVRVVGLFV